MEQHEFEMMAEMEEKHWWFLARREIISSMLGKLDLPTNAKVLEIGCGSGGNLAMLAKFGEVYAIEPNDTARERAEKKGLAKAIEKKRLPEIPFADKRFDLIVLLDALEHIDEDEKALAALKNVLKDTGVIFITVPAFQFLWSKHDESCHHQRRYDKRSLSEVVARAGYKEKYSSYYNFFLFPVIFSLRMLNKFVFKDEAGTDLKMPTETVNNFLKNIFASERNFLGKISFPFGVSRMLVATKN